MAAHDDFDVAIEEELEKQNRSIVELDQSMTKLKNGGNDELQGGEVVGDENCDMLLVQIEYDSGKDVSSNADEKVLDVLGFAHHHFHSHWTSEELLVNTTDSWTESNGSNGVDGSGWGLSQTYCAPFGFSGEQDGFYSVANDVDMVATTEYNFECEGFIRHGKTSFAPIASLDTVVRIRMRQTYDILDHCLCRTDDGVNDFFVNHLCVVHKLSGSSTSSGSKGVFFCISVVLEELKNGNLYRYSKKASSWIITTYCLDNVLPVDSFLTFMFDSGRKGNLSLQLIGSVHIVERDSLNHYGSL